MKLHHIYSVEEIPTLLVMPTGEGLRVLENEEIYMEYYLHEGKVYITKFTTPFSRGMEEGEK